MCIRERISARPNKIRLKDADHVLYCITQTGSSRRFLRRGLCMGISAPANYREAEFRTKILGIGQ